MISYPQNMFYWVEGEDNFINVTRAQAKVLASKEIQQLVQQQSDGGVPIELDDIPIPLLNLSVFLLDLVL